MQKIAIKVSLFIFIAALITGGVLGIYWLFWKLWLWVVPQIFPTLSANIAKPSYWLFVGALFILSFIGRLLFKSDSK